MTKKTKLKRGRPPKIKGWSVMAAKGQLPVQRKYLGRYLSYVRDGLIQDLGGEEKNLTTAQRVLIDRVVSKLGIIRLIEEYFDESPILNNGKLAYILRENYLAYNNSVRLDLQALGIDKKKTREPLDIKDYIELKVETEKPEGKEGE